ncbi:hypothetical protein PENSPDRAFT_648544 [Peniophora sp. CONT]|nr:hypothetical protein PENSPDRAFT_648544 [Peniophora sp. CONT]
MRECANAAGHFSLCSLLDLRAHRGLSSILYSLSVGRPYASEQLFCRRWLTS